MAALTNFLWLSEFPILNTQKIRLPNAATHLRFSYAGKMPANLGGYAKMKKKGETKPKAAPKPAEKPAEKAGGAKKGGKK